MEFKDDLYQILCIPENSTIRVVKQAYHALAKKYHPDVSSHNGEMFAIITDTYKILSNPESKAKYDQYLIAKHEKERLEKEAESLKYKEANREFKRKTKQFNKAAADVLAEDEDDILDEQNVSNKYYIDPVKEPIFKVIRHFTQYRFENAMAAIWNRNIFVLFCTALIYTIATPLNYIYKALRLEADKKYYRYHWVANIHMTLRNPKIIKPTVWTLFLYILVLIKIFVSILSGMYWVFKNLIVPFLIPNAIRKTFK